MIFNTPSACGGVIPLNTGPGLALGFNTLYFLAHSPAFVGSLEISEMPDINLFKPSFLKAL
jgi:hypothetical protein